MDTLRNIAEKLERFSGTPLEEGLKAVAVHLRVAEEHFRRGREPGDENAFTDVVYRTNHAYEGILKEAYALLSGANAAKKATHEIEQYFEQEGIYKTRVTDLLRQYRQQWRNPSTHEYSLFFTEQEAYLCILSVSAFVSILLDEMSERLGFAQQRTAPAPSLSNLPEDVLEATKQLLIAYVKQYREDIEHLQSRHLTEVEGRIRAFLDAGIPSVEIRAQSTVFPTGGHALEVDMVVKKGAKSVAVEVKRPGDALAEAALAGLATTQMLAYLSASSISHGIVLVLPLTKDGQMVVDEVAIGAGPTQRSVVRIYPKRPHR